jgi:hypothetical protein
MIAEKSDGDDMLCSSSDIPQLQQLDVNIVTNVSVARKVHAFEPLQAIAAVDLSSPSCL